MPHLQRAALSDPPTPDAERLWSSVATSLRECGWSWEPTKAWEHHWVEPWALTADPTGGSGCLANLPALVRTLASETEPESARRRAWWSMSDNCLVLNTLVDRGLCRVFHGHPLTLAGRAGPEQLGRFLLWSAALQEGRPFPPDLVPPVVPLAGPWPTRASVVGGNLGALERLGTTPWRPSPQGRVLLVESLSAPAEQVSARLLALVSDPWWRDIGGLVLGRFTTADKADPGWVSKVLSQLPPNLPVARWPLVGHGADAWTIPLGEAVDFIQA